MLKVQLLETIPDMRGDFRYVLLDFLKSQSDFGYSSLEISRRVRNRGYRFNLKSLEKHLYKLVGENLVWHKWNGFDKCYYWYWRGE